ncbi:MAG: sigma-70 family RNA polymerase sigma factor [Clostridia bacterium]|nr:sigma-70 family RNA polymerase sigma factor [Clostridia bacterium]MDD4799215.1 sigma-70 family RNA polymerase sigma factor [Clostridia bacterium]
MFLLLLESVEKCSDKEFLRELYLKFYPVTYKKVFDLVGQDQEAGDIINDAFIKLIDKTELLRSLSEYQLICYVVLTARHTAINFIRHRDLAKKHIFITDEIENVSIADTSLEEEYLKAEQIGELAQVILQLPEAARSILLDKYYLQMSAEEISRQLGITTSAVWQRINRAKKQARSLLAKRRCGEND